MPVDLSIKIVSMTGDSLVIGYDSSTLDESQDLDTQEVPMATRDGAILVSALKAGTKIVFVGTWETSRGDAGSRVANSDYHIGEAIFSAAGDIYQCSVPGTTAAGADPSWNTTVGASTTDGDVTWIRRNSLYEAGRFIRDTWLKFISNGPVKIQFADDRYLFCQLEHKQLPNWNGDSVQVGWELGFTAADPKWWDATLITQTEAITPIYTRWAPKTVYAINDVRVGITNTRHKFKALNEGTSVTTEPPWNVATAGEVDDTNNVPVWTDGVAKVSGDCVLPTVANTYWYECTAIAGSGYTGATEPTWPTTPGATVIDNPGANQVTWTCRKIITWAEDGALEPVTQAFSVVNNGTSPTAPLIKMSIPAGGIDMTITNTTTAQSFTLNGVSPVAGDLLVDCYEGTVSIDAIDYMPLFDGECLRLDLGTNALTMSWVEPGPTSVSVLHRDQYW